MYCTNCGNEIPDDSVFCTFCGQKIDGEATSMTKKNSLSLRFALKKNSKKIVVSGIVAVAIVGGVFVYLQSNSKIVVTRGFEKTWRAICQEETGLNAYLGINNLEKMVKERKVRQKFSGSISSNWSGIIGNTGIDVQLDSDKAKTISMDAVATVAGMDLGKFSVYKNKEELYASAPDFVDGSFYLDLKDLKDKLNDRDYLESLWDEKNIYIREGLNVDYADLKKQVGNTIESDMKPFYQNMEVRKIEKKSFSMNGKEKKCQGYEVTVKSSDIKKMLEDIADIYVDECMWIGEYEYSLYSDYYNYDDCEKEHNDLKEDIRKHIKNGVGMLKGDLIFQAYIGPKGRLVALELDQKVPSAIVMSLTSETGTIGNVTASVNLLGMKNPMDNMLIQGEVELNNLATLSADLTRVLEDKKNNINDKIEISYSTKGFYGSSSGSVEATGNIDKNTGKWEAEIKKSNPSIICSAEGNFENVKRGKHFSVSLNNIELGVLTKELGLFDLSATYEFGPLKENILNDLPMDDIYNILDMTDDDWMQIEKEIEIAASAIGL